MDTQAFTQAPVTAPATLAGHAGRDAESAALDDEWTVDDVVRSIRKVDRAPHHARRWAAGFGAIVLAAVAVTAGMSAGREPSRSRWRCRRESPPAAAGPATSRAGAVRAVALRRGSRRAGHPPVSRSRNVIVVMPADQDYLSATGIPVAGDRRYGRPHGPRIRSVHVALYVGGRLVAGHGPRGLRGALAGVLGLRAPIDQADAELRFSDPANPFEAYRR